MARSGNRNKEAEIFQTLLIRARAVRHLLVSYLLVKRLARPSRRCPVLCLVFHAVGSRLYYNYVLVPANQKGSPKRAFVYSMRATGV